MKSNDVLRERALRAALVKLVIGIDGADYRTERTDGFGAEVLDLMHEFRTVVAVNGTSVSCAVQDLVYGSVEDQEHVLCELRNEGAGAGAGDTVLK